LNLCSTNLIAQQMSPLAVDLDAGRAAGHRPKE
jgi:hypothetical protein